MRPVRTLIAASLAAGIAVAACEDTLEPPPPPTGGVFQADLQSPNGPEAAALISINAAHVDTVTTDAGTLLLARRSGTRMYVVLVRDQPSTLRFHVHVSDTTTTLDPIVLQVADQDDQLRSVLSGYTVAITR